MDCFFVDSTDIEAGMLRITGKEFHHLSRVMRKAPEDEIYVTSGEGLMYITTIERIDDYSAHCRIDQELPAYNEDPVNVTLVQGVLKNPGKMDWIVEKACELGASRIVPVRTENTVAKGGKIERWRGLALAAMKQCLRCQLPIIDEICSLQLALEQQQDSRLIVCHEEAELRNSLDSVLANSEDRALTIFIGPEGGFSDDEITTLVASGADVVSLGVRRLRSETAAIAALARINSFVDKV
jgi:16S rRNA (uracil1498-N3)-methyltransferase